MVNARDWAPLVPMDQLRDQKIGRNGRGSLFHESDDLIVETPLREAVHFGVAVRKLSDLREPRPKLGILSNRA